jgi:hypothetical protein
MRPQFASFLHTHAGPRERLMALECTPLLCKDDIYSFATMDILANLGGKS